MTCDASTVAMFIGAKQAGTSCTKLIFFHSIFLGVMTSDISPAFWLLECSKQLPPPPPPKLTSFWLQQSQHMYFEDKMLDQISLWRLPPSCVSLVQNLLGSGALSFICAWIWLVEHLLKNGAISYWCQNLIEFTKPTLLMVLNFNWC